MFLQLIHVRWWLLHTTLNLPRWYSGGDLRCPQILEAVKMISTFNCSKMWRKCSPPRRISSGRSALSTVCLRWRQVRSECHLWGSAGVVSDRQSRSLTSDGVWWLPVVERILKNRHASYGTSTVIFIDRVIPVVTITRRSTLNQVG